MDLGNIDRLRNLLDLKDLQRPLHRARHLLDLRHLYGLLNEDVHDRFHVLDLGHLDRRPNLPSDRDHLLDDRGD